VNIYRPAWLLPRDQQFTAKSVGTLQVRQGLLTAIVAIAGIGRQTWQGLIRVASAAAGSACPVCGKRPRLTLKH
jgi:hypothetical protein